MLCDLHTHTAYSFDGTSDALKVAKAAQAAGLGCVAITNHYDIDGITEGLYPDYDEEGDSKEIAAAKLAAGEQIKIIYGIELGQPQNMTNAALAFISRRKFEYVLCSIHNLLRCPDFCFLDYSKLTDGYCTKLWERYLRETLDLLRFPRIDTIAHIGYPLRYMHAAGRSPDRALTDGLEDEVVGLIAQRGIALEVNTSTLRTGCGFTMADDIILAKYKKAGGKYVTVGSDAHRPEDVGSDVAEVTAKLVASGFTPVIPIKK